MAPIPNDHFPLHPWPTPESAVERVISYERQSRSDALRQCRHGPDLRNRLAVIRVGDAAEVRLNAQAALSATANKGARAHNRGKREHRR